jgi:hypothetical protein
MDYVRLSGTRTLGWGEEGGEPTTIIDFHLNRLAYGGQLYLSGQPKDSWLNPAQLSPLKTSVYDKQGCGPN